MNRPTGAELLTMSDREFGRYLRSIGMTPARPGWGHRFGSVAVVLGLLLLVIAVLGIAWTFAEFLLFLVDLPV